jgi:hypothetical protein
MPSFQFDGYTLRPAVGDVDRALAAAWMAADRWHAGLFAPEFWLEQSALVNSFVLEDAQGPIFFFRTCLACRSGGGDGPGFGGFSIYKGVEVFIQFAPMSRGTFILRTATALERGFAWLKKRLGGLGYDAVYFTSRNPQLIEFAERRLEFIGTAQPDGSTRLKAYLTRAA